VFFAFPMAFSATSRRRLIFSLACACATVALALVAAAPGGAAKGGKIVLGATPHVPNPVCPTPPGDNPPADRVCQGLGRVTGYQVDADGRHNPYKVRQPGTIVAWTVDLGDPDKEEQDFFENQLSKSGPASARLSILKPKDEQKFKLVKQSPVVQLQSSLGENMVITLDDPLRVRKGMIVAITTSTYVPNLALHGASSSDVWRASRPAGECTGEDALLHKSRPQQKAGNQRLYQCDYKGVRLLYAAFLAV
jgi:hypothetical protein